MKRLVSIFTLLTMSFFLGACSQIDTGNVGVSRFGGKTNMEELPQGWHFTGMSTVDEFTTKEVAFQLNDLKPQTSDKLRMADVDMDIYFKANPANVAETTAKYVGDITKHSSIDPRGTSDLIAGFNRVAREARETVYRAVAQFPADTIHLKRDELGQAVISGLQKELDKSDPGTWTVIGVNVRALLTDPEIEKAIQEKVKLDQTIAAKNKEKDLAEAEARRLFAIAEGEARANEKVAASLTPALVQLRLAELQRDAVVAAASKQGNTVLIGGGATPMFNVGK